MNSKKKNIVKEPSEVYKTIPNIINEEMDPILLKLIDNSKQDAKNGKGSTTEEVIKRVSEKFSFLK